MTSEFETGAGFPPEPQAEQVEQLDPVEAGFQAADPVEAGFPMVGDPADEEPADGVAEDGVSEDGHPLVEETMSRLGDLRDKPVAEHGEVYSDIHERLQSALAEADGQGPDGADRV